METPYEEKAANPDDYAYVPDTKTPSTWKLQINDATHIAGAITALTTGFRGNKVEIPSADKPAVIRKIRAAINSKISNPDDKKRLLDRLASVKSKSMDMMLLSQAETNYGAANGTVGKACSTCRWFCASDEDGDAMCHLVEDDPAPITPNGLCDRWEAVPQSAMDTPDPIPVTIVEPMDSEEMSLTNRGILAQLIKVLSDVGSLIEKSLTPTRPDTSNQAFSVFKAQDGKHYWISRHTGKFVDREDEIITDKAHTEYVDRVQKGLVPLPELWIWHKKGTRHGQADMVWKSGGFVLALGHFDDTPEAQKAISFYQKHAGDIKLSHMFHYPKSAKQGGVYHAYNTVEITTLPDGAEAFPYTSFEEVQPMLTDSQRAFIKQIGGDDMLQRVEAADTKALADTGTLETRGIQSKGLDNFEGATIEVNPDVEALKTVVSDFETRLKGVETVPATLSALDASVKALSKQLEGMVQAEAEALKKANDLERRLLEYQAVAPPASKSTDTLLNEREKSLIENIMATSKADDTPSLVDRLVGTAPAVTA